MNPSKDQLLAILDRLEALESQVLAWGIADVNISEKELESVLTDSGVGPEEHAVVTEALIREALLIPTSGAPPTFRTRSAETVRLVSRLRQWFGKGRGGEVRVGEQNPTHNKMMVHEDDADSWGDARHLISDFRFRAAPRKRPMRNISPDAFLGGGHLDQAEQDSGTVKDCLRVLLNGRNLSAFQSRAAATVLGLNKSERDGAVVITAGTGSGKTLAFYLPVLADLLSRGRTRGGPSVVAIYPRNELLKDQLQTAFSECRQADELAAKLGQKPLRVGALYGGVPSNPADVEKRWDKRREGRVCPFLKCPDGKCGGELLWRDKDRHAGKQRFICTGCEKEVSGDVLSFTRVDLKREAPDLLFVSMEMLNRSMHHPWMRSMVGLGGGAPRFVLLDEIHTYGGLSGAQNALVLGRWRKQLPWSSTVHWVGLSATLRHPKEFFHQLIPVWSRELIHHVEPGEEEMESRGKHYDLILRGDPLSQAALLAVTIQALMLLARAACLPTGKGTDDPRGMPLPSAWQSEVFGSKVFAFTDTLDVFRRLWDNLKDAENNKLPWLRSWVEGRDTLNKNRFESGQLWRLPERLGHDLAQPLKVDGLSSRASMDISTSDVVVATSTLEVGYDDPDVNVVLQHKAPRDWASYLQRIGRAGRDVGMRPWAVTVLSDYGRDRIAYQNYHEFFDPSINHRSIPTKNSYVIRIQAAFALLDLLAREGTKHRLRELQGALFSFHNPRNQEEKEKAEKSMAGYRHILDDLLSDEVRLTKTLARMLQLEEGSPLLREVLWRPPRSIMMEFIPALQRHLDGGSNQDEITVWGKTLSYFIPGTLFSSLNLPEVTLAIGGSSEPSESLPIGQALSEYAPFNVSRRLGDASPGSAHWVAPGNIEQALKQKYNEGHAGPIEMSVLEIASCAEEANLTVEGQDGGLPVYRPFILKLNNVPEIGTDRSRGRFLWQSRFRETLDLPEVAIPRGADLHGLIHGLQFALNIDGRPIEIVRFSEEAQGTLKLNGTAARFYPEDPTLSVRFTGKEGKPAAVGFVLEADAVGIKFDLPPDLRESWVRSGHADLAWRRIDFFKVAFRRLLDGQVHDNRTLNVFALDRCADTFLTTVMEYSISHGMDLGASINRFRSDEGLFSQRLNYIASCTLNRSDFDDGFAHTTETGERVQGMLEDSAIRMPLLSCASILHEDVAEAEWAEDFEYWIAERAATAIGASFLGAVQALLPDLDCQALSCDVARLPGVTGELGQIWISENEPGGVGACVQIRREVERHPERFLSVWASKIQSSDSEQLDADLTALVRALNDVSEIGEAAEAFRAPTSVEAQERAYQSLMEAVRSMGIIPTHGLMTAFMTRFLGPGSDGVFDTILQEMVDTRDRGDKDLGVELTSQAIALCGARSPTVHRLISEFRPWKDTFSSMDSHSDGDRETWVFNKLCGALWGRGHIYASQALDYYNRFVDSVGMDLHALRPHLPHHDAIDVSGTEWWGLLEEKLRTTPRVALRVDLGSYQVLAGALRTIAVKPVGYSAMQVHLEIESVVRDSQSWRALVVAPGYMQ